MIGQTILHYKILEKLGQGGMGVVYKAEDTKLSRIVALKFLPRQIASNEEERKRFEVEAKAAASLNHPNIATIHAIEEHDDEMFIVMEYIDGQELKDVIEVQNDEPLPLDKIVNYAYQIVSGLQTAHENGIVHRDIKATNIMLTDKGDIKIMDFGLAKFSDQTKLTKEGSTLGTIAYMSPEQTQGATVDYRSDFFSLGVLLYEMLTGRMPFMGDYDQAVVYSILNEDPEPISSLRSDMPDDLERIVNKCLKKNPSDRYQHAEELTVDIGELKKEIRTNDLLVRSTSKVSRKSIAESKYLAHTIVVLAVLIMLVAYFIIKYEPGNTIRLINPRQLTSGIGVEKSPTWSPDGGRLAYAGLPGGQNTDIWLLQLGGGQPVNLTASFKGPDHSPSWSPDGNQIAFWSERNGGGYYTIPAVGGLPRSISNKQSFGAAVWSYDSKELAYSLADTSGTFIEIMSLNNRKSRKLALRGKNAFSLELSWTTDGRAFVYMDASPNAEVTQLRVVRVEDGQSFPVSDGLYNDRSPSWSADGRILYFVSNRGGSMDLWQMPMGRDFKPSGSAEPITTGIGMQQAVFSPDGTKLAYSRGRWVANLWRIEIPKPGDGPKTWADAEQITFDNAFIQFVDITPDGKDLFFSSDRMGNQDLWRMSVNSGELEQLTINPTPDWCPILSPDGKQIAFFAYRSGNRDIWIMPVSGGPAQQLTRYDGMDGGPTWSLDGKTIAFHSPRDGFNHVWLKPVVDGEARRLSNSRLFEFGPSWSPDGQKIAYLSGQSQLDIPELWVRYLDSGEVIHLPNTNNLEYYCWGLDGKKIYFNRVVDFISGELLELSLDSGEIRTLADLNGRYGNLQRVGLATDGRYLYFSWREDTGDLWGMDVEKEE